MLVIPEQYLNFVEDTIFVQVLDNGQIEKRKIETRISDGRKIAVTEGLKESEKIIVPRE